MTAATAANAGAAEDGGSLSWSTSKRCPSEQSSSYHREKWKQRLLSGVGDLHNTLQTSLSLL